MTTCPGTAFTAKDVPRTKDLKKAFELADVDKSGVVRALNQCEIVCLVCLGWCSTSFEQTHVSFHLCQKHVRCHGRWFCLFSCGLSLLRFLNMLVPMCIPFLFINDLPFYLLSPTLSFFLFSGKLWKVDLDEFLGLYSKIKAGQVDGLAGYGMFERRKKK